MLKILEKLYKNKKYPYKRISQVSMIMMVRLRVLSEDKPKEYALALKYFEFLKERTKLRKEDRYDFVFKF